MKDTTRKNVLIIMGAGYIGKRVLEEVVPCMNCDCEEIYFYDNNLNKQGTEYSGRLVLEKKALTDLCNEGNCSIILATDRWKELYALCCELYIDKYVILACDKMFFETKKYQLITYSQDGEDRYLAEMFPQKEQGFYVDVGAHHPFRFSNTYWAYKRGWKGVNIEPNEELFLLFEKYRNNDVNINCGISSESGELTYYKFEEPAFNTFVKEEFEGKREPKEIRKVQVKRLEEVLDEYDVKKIDFLNIDVEGFEIEVLKSNNWKKYVPTYILLEQKVASLEELMNTEEYKFLLKHGYKCDWKGIRTVIYKNSKMQQL